MIQRIQTLYLLIAAVLMAVVLFIPTTNITRELEHHILENPSIDESYLTRNEKNESVLEEEQFIVNRTDEGLTFRPFDPMIMSAVFALAAALPLIAIFLYKKRRLQIGLCVAEIIMLLGAGILAAIGLHFIKAYIAPLSWHQAIAPLLILLSLVAVILAIRAISRDEKLVRSLDRIR